MLCHVAGQSLIPLGRPSPALQAYADGRRLASRFQRRSFDGTIRANLMEQLSRHAGEIDVLVWELYDEQLGVYRMPDGGYVTRTPELAQTGLDREIARETALLQFGTGEHLHEWSRALASWAQALRELDLEERTLFVPPPHVGATSTLLPGAGDAVRQPGDFSVPVEAYRDHAMRALPAMRSLAALDCVEAWSAPRGGDVHAHRLCDAEELATLLDTHARDRSFALPRPTLEPISERRVRVHSETTWATDMALYVFREKQVIIKLPYQAQRYFDVDLPAAGTFQFRVFHRHGDVRRAINSAPVTVP